MLPTNPPPPPGLIRRPPGDSLDGTLHPHSSTYTSKTYDTTFSGLKQAGQKLTQRSSKRGRASNIAGLASFSNSTTTGNSPDMAESNGDNRALIEQLTGMFPEVTVKRTYTFEQMLSLRDSPLSKVQNDLLQNARLMIDSYRKPHQTGDSVNRRETARPYTESDSIVVPGSLITPNSYGNRTMRNNPRQANNIGRSRSIVGKTPENVPGRPLQRQPHMATSTDYQQVIQGSLDINDRPRRERNDSNLQHGGRSSRGPSRAMSDANWRSSSYKAQENNGPSSPQNEPEWMDYVGNGNDDLQSLQSTQDLEAWKRGMRGQLDQHQPSALSLQEDANNVSTNSGSIDPYNSTAFRSAGQKTEQPSSAPRSRLLRLLSSVDDDPNDPQPTNNSKLSHTQGHQRIDTSDQDPMGRLLKVFGDKVSLSQRPGVSGSSSIITSNVESRQPDLSHLTQKIKTPLQETGLYSANTQRDSHIPNTSEKKQQLEQAGEGFNRNSIRNHRASPGLIAASTHINAALRGIVPTSVFMKTARSASTASGGTPEPQASSQHKAKNPNLPEWLLNLSRSGTDSVSPNARSITPNHQAQTPEQPQKKDSVEATMPQHTQEQEYHHHSQQHYSYSAVVANSSDSSKKVKPVQSQVPISDGAPATQAPESIKMTQGPTNTLDSAPYHYQEQEQRLHQQQQQYKLENVPGEGHAAKNNSQQGLVPEATPQNAGEVGNVANHIPTSGFDHGANVNQAPNPQMVQSSSQMHEPQHPVAISGDISGAYYPAQTQPQAHGLPPHLQGLPPYLHGMMFPMHPPPAAGPPPPPMGMMSPMPSFPISPLGVPNVSQQPGESIGVSAGMPLSGDPHEFIRMLASQQQQQQQHHHQQVMDGSGNINVNAAQQHPHTFQPQMMYPPLPSPAGYPGIPMGFGPQSGPIQIPPPPNPYHHPIPGMMMHPPPSQVSHPHYPLSQNEGQQQ
ncbi:hypothetical protein H4219_004033 [Mycoemilia scoparia]|uniref:Uncharacterized protein n=1 Tax=Mycoemilia scoparia TaxID=417184 RepID=A0A9W8DS23_9FUNG|nr:hypothetical protein H4219_004033 [Mycoemilia scoparia]